MKIYSDTLSHADLYEACPRGVRLWHCQRMDHPRVRRQGWIVSLSGSSPYWSQSSFTESHKAATWSEHGVWMAALYKKDPRARIGHYRDLAQFMDETRRLSQHPGNLIGGRAPHYAAPWLRDRELLALTAEVVA